MEQLSAGGASFLLPVRGLLWNEPGLERLREQLLDALSMRLPVALTLQGLGHPPAGESLFASACGTLASMVSEAGGDATALSLVVEAGSLAPRQLWLLRRDHLGRGPLYLLATGALVQPSRDRAERRRQDRFWLECWQLRNAGHVRAAIAPMISSACPLLAPETAAGVFPPAGLQVPPGTAWVCRHLNLLDYASCSGTLDEPALHAALCRTIEAGESEHDRLGWPTAAMRHDAWLNRRLAISIDGIGDLAARRGLDPRSFRTLEELGTLLADIRAWAFARSRQMAGEKECPPAFNLPGTGAGGAHEALSSGWRERWQDALLYSATRHRNLLALSPWSMFPSGTAADFRYSELLPLLAYADACSFPTPPNLGHWNINEFRYFHNRAWAVLEQKDARAADCGKGVN